MTCMTYGSIRLYALIVFFQQQYPSTEASRHIGLHILVSVNYVRETAHVETDICKNAVDCASYLINSEL